MYVLSPLGSLIGQSLIARDFRTGLVIDNPFDVTDN